MKAVIFGTRGMGRGAAYDLVRNPEVEKVLVLDKNIDAVVAIAQKLDSSKVEFGTINVADVSAAVRAMRGYDAAISCVPYHFNYALAQAAISARCNFLDLGGNNDVVQQELSLHEKARERGVLIVPDCGNTPGMPSVIMSDTEQTLKVIESFRTFVGGLPQKPQGPLKHAQTFSISGMVNEYKEDCQILRNGLIAAVPALEELEEIEFPPYGRFEAFNTSGGTSTLPYMYQGKIQTLECKTLRYPGHVEAYQKIRDKAESREDLERTLSKILPTNREDIMLFRVVAEGMKEGEKYRVTYEMVDKYDAHTGLTAMMRTTAFPATILMSMIGSGRISLKGAYTQEHFAPAEEIFAELNERGIMVEKTVENI